MPKKKKRKTKKKSKKKTHKVKTKDNIVKIQVETKSPKKKKRKKSTRKKKKRKTKKTTKKRTKATKEKVQIELQPVFVENFVALQKIMVSLTQKYDSLNTKISKLLELFETSAKTLAKKDFKLGNEETVEGQKEILDKVKTLEDQNKIIAKGMTMLHEQQQGISQAQAPPQVPTGPGPTGQPVRGTAPNQSTAGNQNTSAPHQSKTPNNQGGQEEQYKKSASFKPLKK